MLVILKYLTMWGVVKQHEEYTLREYTHDFVNIKNKITEKQNITKWGKWLLQKTNFISTSKVAKRMFHTSF